MPVVIPIIMAAAALAQATTGVVQAIKANKALKDAMRKRKPYQTPEELYKAMQLAQRNAAGADAEQMQYVTSEADRAFDKSLGVSQRMGVGDANDYAALFAERMRATFKIGDENHRNNLIKYKLFSDSMLAVGDSKTAEWKVLQDQRKNDEQGAVQRRADGGKNIYGGVNALVGAYSAYQTGNLYGDKGGGGSTLDQRVTSIPVEPRNPYEIKNPYENRTLSEIKIG
jgi:hypothetical protein